MLISPSFYLLHSRRLAFQSGQYDTSLAYVDLALDAIFIAQIFLRAFFLLPEGSLAASRHVIFFKYVVSMTFLEDIVTCFPWDYIALLIHNGVGAYTRMSATTLVCLLFSLGFLRVFRVRIVLAYFTQMARITPPLCFCPEFPLPLVRHHTRAVAA